jgi:Metal-dependent hydrolases of the beta-lactamase superfamily II
MFNEKAEAAIPAEVRMISGCEDKQTSADVSNVSSFKLPDPAGRAGGACTSALLNVLYADKHAPDEALSFKDVLLKMRTILRDKNFTQIPQLSSSRELDVDTKFDITPDGFSGTKRAVLIGINYVGQDGELSGCHNDVLNMKEYLMDVHNFEEENMTVLLDDGVHEDPTKDNILNAYRKLVLESEPGDCVYCHYSGHGAKVRDDNNDEADGYDETLVPLDYGNSGMIRDDDLLKTLVIPMKKGVFVTSIMDCCHSGTVLDLPYTFKADGEQDSMAHNDNFNFDTMMSILSYLNQGNYMGAVSAAVSSGGCCMIS